MPYKDPDKQREYQRLWHSDPTRKDRLRAYARDWRLRNRERVREYDRQWLANNRYKKLEWRTKNRERIRLYGWCERFGIKYSKAPKEFIKLAVAYRQLRQERTEVLYG